jgi:DNA-binding NtrC family response regulator
MPNGNESILIVEDEISIAEAWQQMLRNQGYDVVTKNNPLDALEELEKTPDRFSLIITDLAMPGMRGDVLSAEICKTNPNLPIILCTGYLEDMSTDCPCPSIKKKLFKPFKLHQLVETVRMVIDGF